MSKSCRRQRFPPLPKLTRILCFCSQATRRSKWLSFQSTNSKRLKELCSLIALGHKLVTTCEKITLKIWRWSKFRQKRPFFGGIKLVNKTRHWPQSKLCISFLEIMRSAWIARETTLYTIRSGTISCGFMLIITRLFKMCIKLAPRQDQRCVISQATFNTKNLFLLSKRRLQGHLEKGKNLTLNNHLKNKHLLSNKNLL